MAAAKHSSKQELWNIPSCWGVCVLNKWSTRTMKSLIAYGSIWWMAHPSSAGTPTHGRKSAEKHETWAGRRWPQQWLAVGVFQLNFKEVMAPRTVLIKLKTHSEFWGKAPTPRVSLSKKCFWECKGKRCKCLFRFEIPWCPLKLLSFIAHYHFPASGICSEFFLARFSQHHLESKHSRHIPNRLWWFEGAAHGRTTITRPKPIIS